MSHSNSDRHNYLRPEFWIRDENAFWRNTKYTDRAKAYFEKFIERQAKEADRKHKGI